MNVFAYSLGEDGVIWSPKNIRVCWADAQYPANSWDEPNPSFPGNHLNASQLWSLRSYKIKKNLLVLDPARKSQIQALIEREYTEERTGVHFTGWKTCQAGIDWDLVLLISSQPKSDINGGSVIGRGFKNSEGYVPSNQISQGYVYLNASSESKMVTNDEGILLTALHEFGHVAGLRHEHIRTEALRDPICIKHKISSKTTSEKPSLSTKFYGPYDPTSIMNYCFSFLKRHQTGLKYTFTQDAKIKPQLFTHLLDETVINRSVDQAGNEVVVMNTALSKGDVHALRCLYVYPKNSPLCSYQPEL